MKVHIKDKEIELKNTFRSLLIYEKITGKPLNPKTTEDVITYFYSVILASYKDLELTLDEFIDWLDENPKSLLSFSQWVFDMSNRVKEDVEQESEEENSDLKKNS